MKMSFSKALAKEKITARAMTTQFSDNGFEQLSDKSNKLVSIGEQQLVPIP